MFLDFFFWSGWFMDTYVLRHFFFDMYMFMYESKNVGVTTYEMLNHEFFSYKYFLNLMNLKNIYVYFYTMLFFFRMEMLLFKLTLLYNNVNLNNSNNGNLNFMKFKLPLFLYYRSMVFDKMRLSFKYVLFSYLTNLRILNMFDALKKMNLLVMSTWLLKLDYSKHFLFYLFKEELKYMWLLKNINIMNFKRFYLNKLRQLSKNRLKFMMLGTNSLLAYKIEHLILNFMTLNEKISTMQFNAVDLLSDHVHNMKSKKNLKWLYFQSMLLFSSILVFPGRKIIVSLKKNVMGSNSIVFSIAFNWSRYMSYMLYIYVYDFGFANIGNLNCILSIFCGVSAMMEDLCYWSLVLGSSIFLIVKK